MTSALALVADIPFHCFTRNNQRKHHIHNLPWPLQLAPSAAQREKAPERERRLLFSLEPQYHKEATIGSSNTNLKDLRVPFEGFPLNLGPEDD